MRTISVPKTHDFLALPAFSMLLLFAGDGFANCIDYEPHFRWLASVEIQGGGKAAAIGDYAILADYYYGVEIVDLSDPLHPDLASNLHIATACCVEAVGTRGYVACNQNGLSVINLSNPQLPWILGSVDTPGTAQDVILSGTHVYIADGAHGLRAIDISDPSDPTLEGWDWVQGGVCTGVEIEGDYAFAAYQESGLQIADITDQDSPEFVASLPLHRAAHDVEIRGGMGYVAGGSAGSNQSSIIYVVDFSVPLVPQLLDSLETVSFRDWYLDGDFLYLVDPLTIIDLAEPAAPRIVETIASPGEIRSVAVVGDHLVAVNEDPYNGHVPLLNVFALGTRETVDVLTEWDAQANLFDMAVNGVFMYVGTEGFLEIHDVTDPTEPVLRSWIDIGDVARSVVVQGDYAFLGIGSDRMQIMDISDPDLPEPRGAIPTGLQMGEMAIRDRYLYMGAERHLYVTDILDADAPVVVSEVDIPVVSAIALAGSHAYIADQDYGLHVVDISDPTAPVEVGSLPLPPTTPFAMDIAVEGTYAYVPTYPRELHVVDVSDPTYPKSAGVAPIPFPGSGITIRNGFAYVSSLGPGVVIYDLSDPEDPRIVGLLESPAMVWKFATNDQWLYLAAWTRALGIAALHCEATYVITEPNRIPEAIDFHLFPNPAQGAVRIDLSGVGTRTAHLAIFDTAGRRVRGLTLDSFKSTQDGIGWDARDDDGKPVASGVYWVRLCVAGMAHSRPVVVLRP